MVVVGIVSKEYRLRNSSIAASESLIQDAPKCSDRPPLFIEEVFEEPWLVEWRWIRVSLSIFAEFGNPITWFLRIDDREKISRIKKGPAGITQNPQIIAFYTDQDVRLTKSQVSVARG